jgi:hypothetical protein
MPIAVSATVALRRADEAHAVERCGASSVGSAAELPEVT